MASKTASDLIKQWLAQDDLYDMEVFPQIAEALNESAKSIVINEHDWFIHLLQSHIEADGGELSEVMDDLIDAVIDRQRQMFYNGPGEEKGAEDKP